MKLSAHNTAEKLIANATFRRIHAYAASFGESLARSYITDRSEPGDVVLDPFSGASTTLLEARLLGRSAIGIDIDPIACLIGRVLTAQLSSGALYTLEKNVGDLLSQIEQELSSLSISADTCRPGAEVAVCGLFGLVPEHEQIAYWFAPVQRALLAVLVAMADVYPAVELRDVLRLAISAAIIHKWPYTLTQARDLDHSRPHRVLREALSIDEQANVFRRSLSKVVKTLAALNVLPVSPNLFYKVVEDDAAAALSSTAVASVDYVLTSPPYFDAIDYPRAHQFSQWWLWPHRSPLRRNLYIGLRPGESEGDVEGLCRSVLDGSSFQQAYRLNGASKAKFLSFCRYIVDLHEIVKDIGAVLKPNKVATFVVANNSIRGLKAPVLEAVTTLMQRNGFSDIQVEEREIDVGKRRYPYGIRGFKGLMRAEFVIHGTRGGTVA